METETKTVGWQLLPPDEFSDPEHVGMLQYVGGPANEDVTREDLQHLVQQAYDQHGILATPDLDTEVARAVETHPGLCRCGQENCSDRDTILRAFADRWGQSLRGRS